MAVETKKSETCRSAFFDIGSGTDVIARYYFDRQLPVAGLGFKVLRETPCKHSAQQISILHGVARVLPVVASFAVMVLPGSRIEAGITTSCEVRKFWAPETLFGTYVEIHVIRSGRC